MARVLKTASMKPVLKTTANMLLNTNYGMQPKAAAKKKTPVVSRATRKR